MKDEEKERFPACVSRRYRWYAQFRKMIRQASVRRAEARARIRLPSGVTPDGEARWPSAAVQRPSNPPLSYCNKGALWIEEDLSRPEILPLVREFTRLKETLGSRGLKYTNTAATFLSRMFYPRSERSKLWENTWVLHHAAARAPYRVLDIGGASTLFSYVLAGRGCDVTVLDNDWGNCGTLVNAEYVGRRMGWKLKALDRDVDRPFPFADHSFDRVYSICTLEHLTSDQRRRMMKETGRILKPGGVAGLTMCYDNNHRVLLVDKGLRFAYPEKLMRDVISPSGLRIYGNPDLVEHQKTDDFLGALFLVKD